MSVENILSNFRAIMVYVFILDFLSIEMFIQYVCCKGHLNKALTDQKMYMLSIWNWLDERIFKSLVQS